MKFSAQNMQYNYGAQKVAKSAKVYYDVQKKAQHRAQQQKKLLLYIKKQVWKGLKKGTESI